MTPLLALLALLAPQETAADRFAGLTADIQRFVDENRLPGVAVGIVDDGEVVYARGFGVRSRATGAPVTTRSIFHMASVSKPFTATAVMQLVEDGKLALSDTIVAHLPWFRLADERAREITLLQVLTHTSGFPDVRDYEWDRPQHDAGAAERYVRSLADQEMLFAPGQGERYSNMAFDTLAVVIAEASGLSFEQHVRTRILEPLGMRASSFVHAETPEEHRTQGHSVGFSDRVFPQPCPVYPYNRRHAPSSTLNSNVDDMCRWMLANLARGELDGARILADASYDVLWSADDDTPGIGLAWVLEETYGRPAVMHTGADTGFNSRVILFPGEGVGVVLMSNCDDARLGALANAPILAALGEAYTLPGPRLASEIAWFVDEHGPTAAVERCLELRETEPERWDFSFPQLDRLCEALIRRGRHADAVELAALNADMHPNLGVAYTRLGQAQAGAGDPDGARASFELALEFTPGDRDAREGLAALPE